LKYKLPRRDKKCAGFTIVEVIIAILVFALFAGILMYLYSRSSDSFKITTWKQKRTAESEIFWAFLRKHLEEATNELEVEPFVHNPDIMVNIKPCKFHPNPDVASGNILVWNCSKVNFNFVPSPNHTVDHSILKLVRSNNKLELKNGAKAIAKIQDVDSVSLKVTSIKKQPDNQEILIDGPDPDGVGAVIEISLVLTPPEGYLAKNLKIVQNHKFRINVAAISDTAPNY
jgi:prepilin-type N-terminal cleavage/methylation domain-containing protein